MSHNVIKKNNSIKISNYRELASNSRDHSIRHCYDIKQHRDFGYDRKISFDVENEVPYGHKGMSISATGVTLHIRDRGTYADRRTVFADTVFTDIDEVVIRNNDGKIKKMVLKDVRISYKYKYASSLFQTDGMNTINGVNNFCGIGDDAFNNKCSHAFKHSIDNMLNHYTGRRCNARPIKIATVNDALGKMNNKGDPLLLISDCSKCDLIGGEHTYHRKNRNDINPITSALESKNKTLDPMTLSPTECKTLIIKGNINKSKASNHIEGGNHIEVSDISAYVPSYIHPSERFNGIDDYDYDYDHGALYITIGLANVLY